MKKPELVYLLILVLAIINLGLIYVQFFKNSSSSVNGADRTHDWLDKNLALTDRQESLHVQLRNTYFNNLRVINDTIALIKARFVAQSSQYDLSDSSAAYWTDSINRWQRKADALTYRHVRAFRNMLEPEQQPLLDSLVQVMMLRKVKGRE
jgi:hypothetical protein